METLVLVLAVLAAVLVMSCGVWVAIVLMATVARVKRPAGPAADTPAPEKPRP